MAYSYENELNSMKEAQKRAAVADLENTRNKTLSDLQSEKATNAANYNSQRNTANIQNKLSARNFQEYLASTGRANSGLSSQARLQNANNLNTSLNSINSAEVASNADIARRTTDANNTYNSGVASANATIEANYISNLLAQRQKALENELAERQYQESVRQFNEQMAYNYKQLYSNFSSGSSRKSSKSKKSSSTSDSSISKSSTPQYPTASKGGLTIYGAIKGNTNSSKKTTKTSKKNTKSSLSYQNALKSANKSGVKLAYKR